MKNDNNNNNNNNEIRLQCTKTLYNLSGNHDVTIILSKVPGLITTLHNIMKNFIDIHEIRFLSAGMFRNLAVDTDLTIAKEPGILVSLHNIAMNENEKTDIRTHVIAALGNIASHTSEDNIHLLLDSNIHILAIDLLKQLDISNISSWPDSFGERCLILLMNLCRHEQAALAVKAIGGDDVLNPLVTVRSAKPGINLYSSFAIAFVAGRDEAKKTTGKAALLVEVPKALDHLIDVFKNTLDLKGGSGYSFGIIKLPVIVGAIEILAISDGNKRLLISSQVLDYLIRVLCSFKNNEPQLIGKNSGSTSRAGGGGKDVETASLVIEALVQLSFYYDNDDDLRSKYLNLGVNMIELIDSLIEAPPSQLSQKDKENLVVLRNRLKPLSRTLSDSYDAPTASQSSVSVMISYAWEVNKPYVEQLTTILKQSGIDVWRDEEGSNQISRMGGDIMEKMAEVVSLSSVFIVCLSQAYKVLSSLSSSSLSSLSLLSLSSSLSSSSSLSLLSSSLSSSSSQ